MNKLPDDLLQYLRCKKLALPQKQLIRELIKDLRCKQMSAAEYAQMYARRAKKIKPM